MPDQLTGKTAIITGGGSGIGRAISLGFAREGADIAACDLNVEGTEATAASVREIGRKAISVALDVSDSAQVDAMVARVLSELGRVDILINCAGIWPRHTVLEMSEDEWRRVLDVNLTGTFLCSRAAARPMAAQGSGKIVNIASGRAITGGTNGAHYSASKAGIMGFTVSAAVELGPLGINMNAIAPGIIDTPFLLAPRPAPGTVSTAPVNRRLEQPEEVVPTALFLVTDAGRSYFGQTIFMKQP